MCVKTGVKRGVPRTVFYHASCATHVNLHAKCPSSFVRKNRCQKGVPRSVFYHASAAYHVNLHAKCPSSFVRKNRRQKGVPRSVFYHASGVDHVNVHAQIATEQAPGQAAHFCNVILCVKTHVKKASRVACFTTQVPSTT